MSFLSQVRPSFTITATGITTGPNQVAAVKQLFLTRHPDANRVRAKIEWTSWRAARSPRKGIRSEPDTTCHPTEEVQDIVA